MGLIPKMSKEEFKWWKEDNKGKFYGMCGAGAAGVFALLLLFLGALGGEEETPIQEDEVVTEIEVGEFDVEGAIEEKQKSQEEEMASRYGGVFSLSPYSARQAHGGAFVEASYRPGEPFTVYVPDGAGSFGSISSGTWDSLSLDSKIYALRGTFEDVGDELVGEWEEEDLRSVLLLFSDPKFNKGTAAAWNNHLKECKVARGYKKNEKQENMADDDWDYIMEEMFSWFEAYLSSVGENGKQIAEDGTETAGILDAYLAQHPLPEYIGIKAAAGSIYLCEKNGIPYGELSDEAVASYRDLYWETYFADAKEEFLNENDSVGIYGRAYEDGAAYRLAKPVPFSLQNDGRRDELVVWLRYADGTQECRYYPARMWSTTEEKYLDGYYTVPVRENVEYFGYFLVGKEYGVMHEAQFETALAEGNEWDSGVLCVEDAICYRREDFYGAETVMPLSQFVMSDGPFELPEGIAFLVNDTQYTVNLEEESEGTRAELSPGEEIFIDRAHVNSVSWRVR